MLRSISRGLAVAGLTVALVVPMTGAAIAAPSNSRTVMCATHDGCSGRHDDRRDRGDRGDRDRGDRGDRRDRGDRDDRWGRGDRGDWWGRGDGCRCEGRDGFGFGRRDGFEFGRRDGLGFDRGLAGLGLLGIL